SQRRLDFGRGHLDAALLAGVVDDFLVDEQLQLFRALAGDQVFAEVLAGDRRGTVDVGDDVVLVLRRRLRHGERRRFLGANHRDGRRRGGCLRPDAAAAAVERQRPDAYPACQQDDFAPAPHKGPAVLRRSHVLYPPSAPETARPCGGWSPGRAKGWTDIASDPREDKIRRRRGPAPTRPRRRGGSRAERTFPSWKGRSRRRKPGRTAAAAGWCARRASSRPPSDRRERPPAPAPRRHANGSRGPRRAPRRG